MRYSCIARQTHADHGAVFSGTSGARTVFAAVCARYVPPVRSTEIHTFYACLPDGRPVRVVQTFAVSGQGVPGCDLKADLLLPEGHPQICLPLWQSLVCAAVCGMEPVLSAPSGTAVAEAWPQVCAAVPSVRRTDLLLADIPRAGGGGMQYVINGRKPAPPQGWERLLPDDALPMRILLEDTRCSNTDVRRTLRQLCATHPLTAPEDLLSLLEQRRSVSALGGQQIPLFQYLDQDSRALMLTYFLGQLHGAALCDEDRQVRRAFRHALRTGEPAASEALPWIHALYYYRTPCRGRRMQRPLSTRDYVRLTSGADEERAYRAAVAALYMLMQADVARKDRAAHLRVRRFLHLHSRYSRHVRRKIVGETRRSLSIFLRRSLRMIKRLIGFYF